MKKTHRKEVRVEMTKIKNNIPHKFTNSTDNDEHIMVINGAIGESGWFYEATSANDVRNALKDVKASTIRIKLNSGGGDVFEGIEIYNYLKDLEAYVIVEVTALAASAATLICSGADKVIMRTGSTYMAHEASTFAYGTKSDIQKTMNALTAIDESIVSIYQQKTGLDTDEIRNIIEDETWFTAEEALAKGFVDEIETVQEQQEDEPTNVFANQQVVVNVNEEKIVEKVLEKIKAESETPKPVGNKTGLGRFAF